MPFLRTFHFIEAAEYRSGSRSRIRERRFYAYRCGDVIRLEAARTSANFFNVLSVRPIIGRSFLPEDTTGRDQVAMISERLWRQRFNSDPGILGRKINLDLKAYTVVGVLPEKFQFDPLGTRTDIWVPSLTNMSALTPQQVEAGACYLNAIARLTPGSSILVAQAGLALHQAEFLRQYAGSGDADPKRILEVIPLAEKLIGEYRSMFLRPPATVFLFLMIACANVAGLSLARAVDRRKEVALRIALGATRLHVVAQLAAENLLLACRRRSNRNRVEPGRRALLGRFRFPGRSASACLRLGAQLASTGFQCRSFGTHRSLMRARAGFAVRRSESERNAGEAVVEGSEADGVTSRAVFWWLAKSRSLSCCWWGRQFWDTASLDFAVNRWASRRRMF